MVPFPRTGGDISRKLAFDSTFWVSPIYHGRLDPYKEYVESVEQKNAKINGLEGQTVQNKE
jgi:hypothetical protein